MESKQSVVLVENLRPSEIRFAAAMQQLGYGSFEALRITAGELELDPWPTTVRSVKFGSATTNQPGFEAGQFELKKQVAELFAQGAHHQRRYDSGSRSSGWAAIFNGNS